jgi:hypothetical protein
MKREDPKNRRRGKIIDGNDYSDLSLYLSGRIQMSERTTCYVFIGFYLPGRAPVEVTVSC